MQTQPQRQSVCDTFILPGLFLLVMLALQLPQPVRGQAGPPFDLLLLGGQVLDGSGNPWFYADVGIRDDKIARVGRLKDKPASRVLDVTGRRLVPGFIDLHSHADGILRFEQGLSSEDAKRRAAPNLISQGITTVVVNQDGRSPWPIAEQRQRLGQAGIGPNALLLAGHGTIRSTVLKSNFRRAATLAEIQQMRQMVHQAMEEGAYGLSVGLEYSPGRWSTTDELVALVAEIVPYGGVYIAHQRSEGPDPMWYWPSQDGTNAPPTLLQAVRETIEVGERTGATVVASHLKVKGAHYWGASGQVIHLIAQARARGVSVWADQYPYNTSGSDGNTVLIPRWAFEHQQGTNDSGEQITPKTDFARILRKRLKDKRRAHEIRQDIAHEIRRRGGADHILVFDYPDTAYIGKSLQELSEQRHITPVAMALRLQLEGFHDRRGGARLRGFSMSEEDVEAFMSQPWTATSSDAGVALPEDGAVHPRFYGTFPRKIRRYALDRHSISLEHAVRSSTSLPAQILGLRHRGMIREGFWADLVVLDLERLRDRATFFKPHQYAEGIDYVLVNGEMVVEAGQLTGKLPGVVITPATAKGSDPLKEAEAGFRE
ncbi:MAG: amidohydrolase family protein [bacterium]